ncbi:hypothetical protein OIU79_011621, partial [Salix purpurea]
MIIKKMEQKKKTMYFLILMLFLPKLIFLQMHHMFFLSCPFGSRRDRTIRSKPFCRQMYCRSEPTKEANITLIIYCCVWLEVMNCIIE